MTHLVFDSGSNSSSHFFNNFFLLCVGNGIIGHLVWGVRILTAAGLVIVSNFSLDSTNEGYSQ